MEDNTVFELSVEDLMDIMGGKKTIDEVFDEKKKEPFEFKKENIKKIEFDQAKGNTFEEHLKYLLGCMERFLKEKNLKYGNAALEPINVFSNDYSEKGICVRIDDKISRIKNSDELRKNDVVDLTGYLILLLIKKGWLDFYDLED